MLTDRDVWRDTTPMANRSTAKPARPRDPLRRDRPAPCGQVDSRSATDHFPTGPETATEAVNSYGHKPVNSECSRHPHFPSIVDIQCGEKAILL